MEKKGVSSIITIVLILLLILAAIIIIWNVIYSVVYNSSQQANLDIFTNKVLITEAKVFTNGDLNIKVKRELGTGNLNGLLFNIYDINKKSYSVRKTDIDLKELETKDYYIKGYEINAEAPIEKISVTPIINDKYGLESYEPENTIKIDSSGNRILEVYSYPTGLASWWKFDGNPNDSIDGNNGNFSSSFNQPSLTTGKINQAYRFDGMSDYVYIKDNLSLRYTGGEMTISAWLNKPASETTGMILSKSVTGGGTYNYFIDLQDSVLRFIVSGNITKALPSIKISSDEWHFVTGVINPSSMYIYVDGILISSLNHGITNWTLSSTDNALSIGTLYPYIGNFNNPSLSFNGTIDEVMIYNRSLAPDEILGIYNFQR